MEQTIQFADGDAKTSELYRRFATQRGYQTEFSSDGLDCMKKLREMTPKVLVLDFALPWGGGDGVLAWLREEPQFLPSRIVLTCTATVPAHLYSSLVLLNSSIDPQGAFIKTLMKPFPLAALFVGDAIPKCEQRGNPYPKMTNGDERRGVLVDDDELPIRDILQKRLRGEGFRVWTAANGEEALDHCCDHINEIAVVLLDVRMPGLDGPQTLDGIRELDAEIPVCFMTGNPGTYEPSELLRQGARHLFGKPLRMDEIIRVVHNLANEPAR